MPTLPSRLETQKFPVAPSLLDRFFCEDTDGELAFGWDENPDKQQAAVVFVLVESWNSQKINGESC